MSVRHSTDELPPSPKRVCLDPEDDEGPGVVRCSTPIPALDDTIDLNDQSFESFIEEVEEEQEEAAAQDLSQHGIDDQSFSDFLQDVAADDQPVASAAVIDSTLKTQDTTVNGLVFPKEVLENIFCRLGLVDLYASTRRVCRLWNSIITAEGFIKWKQLYFETKREPDKMPEVRYGHQPSLLLDIASFVKNEFSRIKTPLKSVLRQHPQYSCVSRLSQQHQSESEDGGTVLVLSDLEELVLLVACCRSVHQLIDLVHLLTRPMRGGFSSPALSYSEISEILYCLATVFRKGPNDSPRTHYYLYYVLDVLERRAAVHVELDEPDGVTASAAKLTNEQLRIVNHKFEPGHTVKVIALAGTGKTTTLYHIARSNPRVNFLYCVYNKSVQQHAEKSIFADCANVHTKTFHALAFPHTAWHYKDAGKLGSDLHALYISWHIHSELYKYKKLSLANCVRDTINHYLASADEELSHRHVVSKNMSDHFPDAVVLQEAKHYWDLMKSLDPDTTKVKMIHDGYLKLYQLRKPLNLSTYDVILVDEAQDLSPAVTDILSRQKTAKVYVGDPNQQIYSFRGATNALDQITATHTYSLTRSFRFGPEISYACELALSYFKPKKTQILIGTTAEDSIDGSTRTGQMAVLCRLNSTLFDEVVKVLNARPKARIGFAGTAQMSDLNTKYRFDTIEDIASLKAGADVRSLKTNDIKWGCRSYVDLVEKARKSGDKAMVGRIKVVDKYGSKIPTLIKRIRSRVTFEMKNADVMFSTAHRSKGLEFETVVVADDFTAAFTVEMYTDFGDDMVLEYHMGPRVIEVDEDERNLVYVAMSRAKKNLILSPAIWDILSKDKYLFPTASAEVCSKCGNKTAFLLLRPKFVLSTESIIPQVIVCRDCSDNIS